MPLHLLSFTAPLLADEPAAASSPSRTLVDTDGDGWDDLWVSLFPKIDRTDFTADANGNGLTNYEDMLGFRDPYAGPQPSPTLESQAREAAVEQERLAAQEWLWAERRAVLAPYLHGPLRLAGGQPASVQELETEHKAEAAQLSTAMTEQARKDKAAIEAWCQENGVPRVQITADGSAVGLEMRNGVLGGVASPSYAAASWVEADVLPGYTHRITVCHLMIVNIPSFLAFLSIIAATLPCKAAVIVRDVDYYFAGPADPEFQNRPLDMNEDGVVDIVFLTGLYASTSVNIGAPAGNNITAHPQGGLDLETVADIVLPGMLIGSELPEPLTWWNDLEYPATLSICGGLVPPLCQGHFGEIYVGLEFAIAGELHYGWVFLESYVAGGHIMRLAYESEPGKPLFVPHPEFRITVFSRTGPSTYTLGWPATVGCVYRLQSSTDLKTWNDVPGDYPANLTLMTAEVSVIPGEPQKFYRVTLIE